MLEWVLAVAALVFLGSTAAVVWSVVVLVRRTARRGRRIARAARTAVPALAAPGGATATAGRARQVVEPARVRVLGVRSLLSPSLAVRHDLARDVLLTRQAYELARRDGRPVADLGPAVQGLERVARSLDVDLRIGRPAPDEVARAREAARSLRVACATVPARGGLLDEVADAAERARLVAEAHRELG